MSFVFKSIEPANITVNPFYANKLWSLGTFTVSNLLDPSGSQITVASMSIYYGAQNTSTFNLAITPEPQTSHGVYTRSVWDSVYNLFYRDFATDPLNHYAQGVDYFETRSIGSTCQVWSIPQQIIGAGIARNSFYAEGYIDDGNGNIISSATGNYAGNIIYDLGLIIWTQAGFTGTTCQVKDNVRFRSTKLINSYEVICISSADEHNMSGNTSLLAIQSSAQNPGLGPNEPGTYNNDGECYSFVTGSAFSPYITSVGLYNDSGDLLVIAKLARPIKKAMNCDTIFVVRWDE